jgi:succinoglycan biosynthesis protein ExoA
MTNSPKKRRPDTPNPLKPPKNEGRRNRVSIVIPSAPDRDFSAILHNLREIKPEGVTFQVLVVKGTWPPIQRNMAIEKADGEYIFLFDDDIIIPKGVIEKVLDEFKSNPHIDVIGGPNLTPPKNTFLQHCFGLAHASAFTGAFTAIRYYPAKKIQNVDAEQLISCNLAFRAGIIKKNPFDPHVFPSEENELLNRIQKNGGKLSYNPEFFVYHHRRKNIYAFFKQIFNWGKGRVLHTFQRYQNFSPAFFVPLVFLIYLTCLIFVREFYFYLPLFFYLILVIIFSIQAALRGKNFLYFFPMLFLLPMTHIAYGL